MPPRRRSTAVRKPRRRFKQPDVMAADVRLSVFPGLKMPVFAGAVAKRRGRARSRTVRQQVRVPLARRPAPRQRRRR